MVANRSMNLYGDAQAPSAYDRPVQWLFILSLLFVPFYGWSLLKYGPGVYRLDPDGTLHLPEGTWSRDEIADESDQDPGAPTTSSRWVRAHRVQAERHSPRRCSWA